MKSPWVLEVDPKFGNKRPYKPHSRETEAEGRCCAEGGRDGATRPRKPEEAGSLLPHSWALLTPRFQPFILQNKGRTHFCCVSPRSVAPPYGSPRTHTGAVQGGTRSWGRSAMALNPACVPGDTSRSVTGARMTRSDLLTLPASGEAHTMGRRCLTWTRGTGRCPGNQVQVEGVASSITQQVPRGHTGHSQRGGHSHQGGHSQRDRQAQPPAAGAGVPGRGEQQ